MEHQQLLGFASCRHDASPLHTDKTQTEGPTFGGVRARARPALLKNKVMFEDCQNAL